MNSREIILANLNHSKPCRCGMNFDNGRMDDILICWPEGDESLEDRQWTDGNQEFYHDEYGNVWVRMIGGCDKGKIYSPILKDWSKIDELVMPDYENPARFVAMREKFSQDEEKFKVACIGGWIFDNARYIRKMEMYFMDMVMYPEKLDILHKMLAKVFAAKINGVGATGAEAVLIYEDMGTQNGLLYSPEMFRRYFKNLYGELVEIAHGYEMKVLMHSCGMNWDILDDLIDVGIDCFQFDQPALYDMDMLAGKFRQNKVALWSPVDIL